MIFYNLEIDGKIVPHTQYTKKSIVEIILEFINEKFPEEIIKIYKLNNFSIRLNEKHYHISYSEHNNKIIEVRYFRTDNDKMFMNGKIWIATAIM